MPWPRVYKSYQLLMTERCYKRQTSAAGAMVVSSLQNVQMRSNCVKSVLGLAHNSGFCTELQWDTRVPL